MIQSIQYLQHSLKEDWCTKKRGESMQYLTAIVCIIALVVINIFGKESTEINSILSAAIIALIYGGVQRGTTPKEPGDTPARRAYKRATQKSDP